MGIRKSPVSNHAYIRFPNTLDTTIPAKDINRIVKINPANSGIYFGTLSLNIYSTIVAPGVEKN
jgi:hypothetical protein